MMGSKVGENTTMKETAIATYRSTVAKGAGLGRTFGAIGVVYSASDCVVETYRAKSDERNSIYAGCLTGAVLSRKGGPVLMMQGCGGFALWSYAMESFMRSSVGEGIFKGHEE